MFAGDGQLISRWGAALEEATVRPTMIVGSHRVADETVRLHEYSPGFDPERFAAHETFFVEDVRRWVRSRFGVTLPAERTAVCGVSASGELALAIGLRHPEVYGAVFSASPGGAYQPPEVMPNALKPADRECSDVQCRQPLQNQLVWTSTARPRTSSPANASAPMPAPSSASGRTTSAGRPAGGHSGCRARRHPRRGAFPATGMALTAGPIARSRTGEHEPPSAVNVLLRHVRFPTLRQWPHHRYTNYRSRSIRVGGYGPLLH